MRYMNKKGFTLIELLAIIIILAIVAVVTVPIILGIIDESKKKSSISSAYGYKEAVNQYYYSKKLVDSDYKVPDDEYEIAVFKNDGLVVSGEEPSEGWVKVVNGNVTSFSFIIGEYAITYDSETNTIQAVKGGELALTPTMQIKKDAKDAAIMIVSNQTGTTGITDITEGWVAFIDGTLKAYSVNVTVSGRDFIVTDENVEYINSELTSNNAVAQEGITLADKTNVEQLIVSYKTDIYVKAVLTANSSLTDETVSTVSEMSGITTNQPNSGWIHFNIYNNSVVIEDYSLTYGTTTANYSSLTDGIYVSTFGNSRNKPVILSGTVKEDGAKYLTTAQIVYYNPTTGSTCEAIDAVSTTPTTTGCLKWYLYSVKGDYANMLLDHNITDVRASIGAWALVADYTAGLTEIKDENENVIGYETIEGEGSKAVSAGITYPGTVTSFPVYVNTNVQGKCARGPVTALNTLKSLTSSWTYTQTPKVPNSTGIDEHIVPANLNNNEYIINYSGYKARLITKEEATYLGCTVLSKKTCPTWMKDNLYTSSTTNLPVAYWTSTPYTSNTYIAWGISTSSLDYYNPSQTYGTGGGVRPVITVLIDDVL